MVKCAALNCTNYWGKKSMTGTIKFHRFPKDPKIFKQWIKICDKPQDITIIHDGICSEHFEESDYRLKDILLNIPLKKRHLKKDAIPKLTTANSSNEKNEITTEPVEDPLSLHERSNDDCLPRTPEDSERRWVLTELVVEPICSLECLTKKEFEQNDLLETAQKSTKTEKIEIIEGKKPATETTEPVQHIKSKTITNKWTLGTAEPEIQTQNPEKKDKAVQTEIEYEVDLEFRIMNAEAEARKLKIALNKATKKRWREETKEKNLKRIFTSGQLKRLLEPNKKFKWSSEDQKAARELYSAGVRSYEILRERGFPLPSLSLQRKWATKSKLKTEPKYVSDPDRETEFVFEPVPEIDLIAAPESVSAPKLALDTEIAAALESILSPVNDPELIPKPKSVPASKPIKRSAIEMYWSEFMDTIA